MRRRSHILVYAPDEGRDPAAWKALGKQVTVWEKVAETRDGRPISVVTFRATVRDRDPKGRPVLRLPGGLPPEQVSAAWPGHEWEPDVPAGKAWAAAPARFTFRSGEFPFGDRDQARIYKYLVAEFEAGEFEPGTKLVKAATGTGKSYATIRAWHQFGDVLLGTFALSAHLRSFHAEILKFTDVSPEEILIVEDGVSELRRVAAAGRGHGFKAVLVLHRTISSSLSGHIDYSDPLSPVSTGTSEFTEFVQALGVGTHVSDEVQLEFRSLVTLSLMMNLRRTIYLSATPGRTVPGEDKVLKNVLPLARMLSIRKEPRLEVFQLRFDSRPEPWEQARCESPRQGYFMPPAYFDYFVTKYERWEAMCVGLVSQCFEHGAAGVAVVVSGKLEFLDRVVGSMARAFPGKTVGNFSSRVKEALRQAELEKDIIVTTEKSFNGSVNPRRTSHLLLFAPVSAPIWVEQITGRLRGKDGLPSVLLDVYDYGFPPLREQARKRRSLYKRIAKSLREEDADF